MRNRCLILLSMVGVLGCGSRLHVGDQLGGGGHAGGGGQGGGGGGQAGSGGGQAGAGAGAAGSIMPSGAAGTGGSGTTTGQAGAGGTPVDNALSVDPSSATFAGTLVEAVSP